MEWFASSTCIHGRLPRVGCVDVQLAEAGSGEGFLAGFVGALVEDFRVGQQAEQFGDGTLAAPQIRHTRLVELGVDRLALLTDVAHLGGEFVLRPVGVADEVKVLVFEYREPVALGFQTPAQGGGGLARFGDDLRHVGLDLLGDAGVDAQRGVVVFDSALDVVDA